MGRRSKDPEIRRMELILAAEALFKEKGFEATSVSDITDKVGVSHGTFFYYFESKNDILKAVIHYYVGLDKELIAKIVNDDSRSAVKKIQAIVDLSMCSNEPSELSENKLVQYMHREGNESLHSEYIKKTQEVMIPLITSIIEQGDQEGSFDVKYPKETVEYILPLFNEYQHSLRDASQSKDAYYRKVRAMEIIINRVLGMKEGGISLLTQ
jgi:AcrR family transcriptional regulator